MCCQNWRRTECSAPNATQKAPVPVYTGTSPAQSSIECEVKSRWACVDSANEWVGTRIPLDHMQSCTAQRAGRNNLAYLCRTKQKLHNWRCCRASCPLIKERNGVCPRAIASNSDRVIPLLLLPVLLQQVFTCCSKLVRIFSCFWILLRQEPVQCTHQGRQTTLPFPKGFGDFSEESFVRFQSPRYCFTRVPNSKSLSFGCLWCWKPPQMRNWENAQKRCLWIKCKQREIDKTDTCKSKRCVFITLVSSSMKGEIVRLYWCCLITSGNRDLSAFWHFQGCRTMLQTQDTCDSTLSENSVSVPTPMVHPNTNAAQSWGSCSSPVNPHPFEKDSTPENLHKIAVGRWFRDLPQTVWCVKMWK